MIGLPARTLLGLFKTGLESQLKRKVKDMNLLYRHAESILSVEIEGKEAPFDPAKADKYVKMIQVLVKAKLDKGKTLDGAKILYYPGEKKYIVELEIYYRDEQGNKLLHQQYL